MHNVWLRLVGSLKLQVSFAKEPYKREDILQKRPIILRSVLIVATPSCEIQCGTHEGPTKQCGKKNEFASGPFENCTANLVFVP